MIIESLDQFKKYLPLHPLFPQTYEFLNLVQQQGFPDGDFPLDGHRCIATVVSGDQEPAGLLAAHRQHITVHYVVSGRDCVGWKPMSTCDIVVTEYESEHDKISYGDPSMTSIDLHQNYVGVFFPYDAYALLPCNDFVKRVIVKLAIDPAS
jgi:beta-galactosidase beta subunit